MDRASELWAELLQAGPTNQDLRYIIEYVEPLRAEAQALLKRGRKEIMDDIRRL